jgi:protoporphyrinogen oxidase
VNEQKKIAVIGAGPAGITAAYELAKAGYKPVVFEGDEAVGGMAKSIKLWGQTVDLGPHRFFSNEKKINQAWLEVVGKDYDMVNRLTRIFYKNRFFYYPLKPLNALFNLGVFEAIRCVLSYFNNLISLKQGDKKTFEHWVVSRFGRRLFEIFFKTYSEKLWGISCADLDADFAAQRIKKLSLFGALWNAVVGGSGNKHKTLVDQFAYPHGGTGMAYERMASFIKEKGGQVITKTLVEKVVLDGRKATGVVLKGDQQHQSFDHVISTMPLTRLVENIPEAPEKVRAACKELKFRNTILVYLEIDALNLFPDNWLYVHSSDIRCGRVTNFCNWTKHINKGSDKTILCMEYWCNFEDDFWGYSDEQLGELASKEIAFTGLIKGANITNSYVRRVPRCYPVYEVGYKEHLDVVTDYLKTLEGISPIGRYGSFKYNNQDHSILMGLNAAENLISGTKHDLWSINTDDEYQEEATITESGMSTSPREALAT